MSRDNDLIFNAVAAFFIFLTVMVCLVTAAWLGDVAPVPDSIAPATDVPLPTLQARPTLGPSPTPIPAEGEETPDVQTTQEAQ